MFKELKIVGKSLLNEIDEMMRKYLIQLVSQNLDDVRKSKDWLNNTLICYGNYKAYSKKDIDGLSYSRIKHIMITFGMGCVFSKFCNLEKIIADTYWVSEDSVEERFLFAWLFVCLYHDYGYFVDREKYKEISSIKKLSIQKSIFDSEAKSRYSQKLYNTYYAVQYKRNKGLYKKDEYNEIGDHGILGGIVLYDTMKEDDADFCGEANGFLGDFCYRIMEHNIWKKDRSYSQRYPFYEIGNDRFKKIDVDEGLLFLLSLVDTMELTKKYFQYHGHLKSKLSSKQIAENINCNVDAERIEIDVTPLIVLLKENEDSFLIEEMEKWKEGVIGLNNWVNVSVVMKDCSKIVITRG